MNVKVKNSYIKNKTKQLDEFTAKVLALSLCVTLLELNAYISLFMLACCFSSRYSVYHVRSVEVV